MGGPVLPVADEAGGPGLSTGRSRTGRGGRSTSQVRRVAVVSALLVLVPLALLTYWSISLSSRSLRDAVNDKLEASAESRAQGASGRMEGAVELATAFAGLPEIVGNVGPGSAGDLAAVQALTDQLKAADPDVSAVGVVEPDGRLVVLSPPDPDLLGQSFATRDWYQGVRQTGQPYVSTAFVIATTPRLPVIGVAAPIRAEGVPDAPLQGILVLGYRIETFQRFAEEVALDEGFELTVTDQTGVVIASPDERAQLTSATGSAAIRRALAGESGSLTSGSYLVGYAPVDGLGWAVQSRERASTALAPARDLRWRVVGAGIPLGAAVVLGLVLLIHALGARSRAEAELAGQQAYSRSMVESSPDAQFAVDGEGVITDVNDESVRSTGRTRDELIGTPLASLMADPESTRAAIERSLAAGSVRDHEVVLRRPDGTTTPLSMNVATFEHEELDHPAVLATARDITEAKRLERLQHEAMEHLREVDALRSDFVSRVSHELRSPLTGVLGYTELLDDGVAGPLNDAQRRMLEVIDRNGHRLQSLVEDLLTLSRVDAGTFRAQMARVALPPLVEHAVDSLSPAIEQRRSHLDTEVDDVVLEADEEQLERVVVNLLSNAVKFTPEDGEVGLRAHRDDGQVVIEVRDTGIGIPREEQPQLFTRFFRSSLSHQMEAQGTGLGLFIVKQIVDAHHGTVEATSEPGEGTVVTVRLPLRQPTDAAAHARR